MAVDDLLPAHGFEQGDGELRLWISLPSLEDVAVDVGASEVRLNQRGRAIVLPLPADLAKDVQGEASAKFSKKRAQLLLAWPTRAVREAPPADTPTPRKEEPSPDSSPPSDAPAFGSIWNKNSWHWEEKNCLDLATQEVRRALEKDPGWKHVHALSGASFVLKDVVVRGDASFALRKGKRILCYELSATFAWEGRDEFGCQLGVKGTGKVSGITPEDDEEALVEIEVSASSKGGPEAKAAGAWMQGQGASLASRALRPPVLREAILAAEVAQAAKPEVERARRAREEEMAAQARASAAASKQKRIAEEARQQEDQTRVRPETGEVAASVWNVNAWHWEEKPMTEWSRKWLQRELGALSGLRLLSGLAEVEFRDVQVSGDASVSVRKGKPIVLYLLRIECRFEAEGSERSGLGEAKGSLILPEFTPEDGHSGSLIQVEIAKDSSRGRLGQAMKKEGIAAVRSLLKRYEEALKGQLKSGPGEPEASA